MACGPPDPQRRSQRRGSRRTSEGRDPSSCVLQIHEIFTTETLFALPIGQVLTPLC